MAGDIPVSVIVLTRNEAHNLPRCLHALRDFAEVVVVDSASTDGTATLAEGDDARVIPFIWNGQYPKKRQWCLDTLSLRHDRIFFVDADEVVTPDLVYEIRNVSWDRDGYFVRGAYVFDGVPLRFGLVNNKLCLFDRRAFSFPVVDDLSAPGMGEIEGHYQPLPRGARKVGQLRHKLLHYSGDDGPAWHARHERYAAWESFMLRHRAYPPEIGLFRSACKGLFRFLPFRPAMAFLHSYVLKGGFFDGRRGFRLAASRHAYYRMVNDAISSASKDAVTDVATATPQTATQK